jgi:hypothetical protein
MRPDTAKMALRNGVVERQTVGVNLVEVGSIIYIFVHLAFPNNRVCCKVCDQTIDGIRGPPK